MSLLPIIALGAAFAATPQVGERLPQLSDEAWVRAPEGRLELILVGNTADPSTRAVIEALAAEDTRLALVAPDRADSLLRMAAVGGWEHLALASLSQEELSAWREDLGSTPSPWALLVDRKRTVLWSDQAVTGAEDPLSDLRSAMSRARDGSLDRKAALRQASERAEAAVLAQRVDELETITALQPVLAELAELATTPQQDYQARARANALAWELVENEVEDEAALREGLALTTAALALRGEDHAALLDTHAALLWRLDQREEAFATQERAVAASWGRLREELLPPLIRYAEALGHPLPDAEPAAAPTWTGTMNDAGRLSGGRELYVRPLPSKDEALEQAWVDEIHTIVDEHHFTDASATPDELSATPRGQDRLVLHGTPGTNPLIAEVLAYNHLALDAEGLLVGGRRYEAVNPYLIAALPAPWDPSQPVQVYTAALERDAIGLNSVFHGPSPLLLGSSREEGREEVLSAPYRTEEGALAALELGPATLSAEEAVEDLRALNTQLASSYAGMADLEWSLRARGTSWQAHTDLTLQRLKTQETWSFEEFSHLVEEHLEPVQDTHFTLTGQGFTDGGVREVSARLVEPMRPWFTDTQVGPDSPLPLVPGPHEVQPGVAYRFPTLPRDGRPSFLTGVFGGEGVEPELPPELAGERLHRAPPPKRVSRWTLEEREGVPVVRVPHMNARALDGLQDTAPRMREFARGVLDLRGNYGGSDQPAWDWATRLSAQPFHAGGGASVEQDDLSPVGHWHGWQDSWRSYSGDAVPDSPYEGGLVVLIDGGVASSGETFAFVASQVPGAVLVGTPTAGCTRYGNVEDHDPLPNSRLVASFGRTRFDWDPVRPVVEGVGMFPDVWLDAEDPVRMVIERAVSQ